MKSIKNTNLQNYDLKKLIKKAISISTVYEKDKKIKITDKTKPEITILADENKFLSVIINMIKNAIESIDKAGEITLLSDDSKDVISLKITNTGGREIDKEMQKHIFDEGFTTKKTGSGLGLYICKKSLEEQFAQLKLNKSDKTETEFEILLPKV